MKKKRKGFSGLVCRVCKKRPAFVNDRCMECIDKEHAKSDAEK